MELENCKTMFHFLRKCVLGKGIYIVDLKPFRDIQWLLSNATNNINQIAKSTNTTGIIYKNKIESMNKQIEKLSKDSAFKENENYENLIFHSDQGWQYQHVFYQKILSEKEDNSKYVKKRK